MRLRAVVVSLATTLTTVLALPGAASAVPKDPGGPSNIIGGTTTRSAPWAAAVFSDGDFTCSGTIISANYVLTAKHCLGGTMSVRIGSVNRQSGGVTRAVTATASRHDLALLRLASPVNTSFMPLADADPPVGSTNSIYGWGRTCFSGCSAAVTLKTATVRVDATDAEDDGGGRALQSTGRSGAAWRGDSGGPEVYNGAQVGVASLADGQTLQIYGSVAGNRAWITSIAGV
ncbi:S1 family peptidase [Krasilnikovia sp. M28-CT-15]|uniref:S1 family peptidase n=1 Tax=Krasilnikovia sp. M28-CT-15 TaxID=3373540 RepID=UPI0038776261